MPEPVKKDLEIAPEVTEKATRRRFTVAYKEQILAEADRCASAGDVGELLRREVHLPAQITVPSHFRNY